MHVGAARRLGGARALTHVAWPLLRLVRSAAITGSDFAATGFLQIRSRLEITLKSLIVDDKLVFSCNAQSVTVLKIGMTSKFAICKPVPCGTTYKSCEAQTTLYELASTASGAKRVGNVRTGADVDRPLMFVLCGKAVVGTTAKVIGLGGSYMCQANQLLGAH